MVSPRIWDQQPQLALQVITSNPTIIYPLSHLSFLCPPQISEITSFLFQYAIHCLSPTQLLSKQMEAIKLKPLYVIATTLPHPHTSLLLPLQTDGQESSLHASSSDCALVSALHLLRNLAPSTIHPLSVFEIPHPMLFPTNLETCSHLLPP